MARPKVVDSVYVSIVMHRDERERLNAHVKRLGVTRNSWLKELIRKEVDGAHQEP